jgi:hypothetical protein
MNCSKVVLRQINAMQLVEYSMYSRSAVQSNPIARLSPDAADELDNRYVD